MGWLKHTQIDLFVTRSWIDTLFSTLQLDVTGLRRCARGCHHSIMCLIDRGPQFMAHRLMWKGEEFAIINRNQTAARCATLPLWTSSFKIQEYLRWFIIVIPDTTNLCVPLYFSGNFIFISILFFRIHRLKVKILIRIPYVFNLITIFVNLTLGWLM